MNIRVQRLKEANDATIGIMFVDDKFECFTLEDLPREPKVFGKTRIPAGSYEVKLRKAGGMVQKYDAKFTGHNGMLWLQDVPNFEYIYIHIGNYDEDTDGCILVGNGVAGDSITDSRDAYITLYAKAQEQLEAGYPVNIEVIDN